MTPVCAPTNSFSARRPMRAVANGSSSNPNAAERARIVLTSSAADDDSPLPMGTRELTRASNAAGSVKRDLDGAQFGRLCLRQAVVRKHASPELGAGQVLETIRAAVRRVDLDVQMGLRMRLAVGWSLVKHEQVGQRALPERV